MRLITVVGSLNMDLTAVSRRLPTPGETCLGLRHFTSFGGKGANQAYAATRLGGRVAMLGRVGRDGHGDAMRANLVSAGCDVAGVRFVDDSSGVALILVSEAGENMITVVPGANACLTPDELRFDEAAILSAAYLMLQLETPLETVLEAARLARGAGATIVLDPAPAVSHLPTDLLRQIDILTPNETEAILLTGGRPGHLSASDAEVVGRSLQARGSPIVIVKLGGRGCLVLEYDKATHVAAPPVEVVDTTAAGDVFNAALVVRLSEGQPLLEAVRFAVVAGALSVTRPGAHSSVPDRAQLDAFASAPTSFPVRGRTSSRLP